MDIITDIRKAVQVLGGEKQALWATLKWSIRQRFDYWSQLCQPSSVVQPVAAKLDRELWKVLETAFGFSIPRIGDESDNIH